MFTAPTTKPLGNEVLRSDPAEPSPFSILSLPRPLPVGPNVARSDDGLVNGALRFDHQRCLQSVESPNCEPGDADDYPAPADDVGPRFYPVGWTVPVGCEGGRVNPMLEQWALEDVQSVTAHRLEAYLWSRASLPDVMGPGTYMPSVMAVAETVGEPSDPVNPRDGLAHALADYLRCTEAGGRATVLVPFDLGPYLLDRGVLVQNGTQLKTATGHDAILGTGFDPQRGPFDNDDPSATDDPADGTAWLAVTGPIFYQLGKAFLTADPTGRLRGGLQRGGVLPGMVDMRQGTPPVAIGARRAQFIFDTCCVRAIKCYVPNARTVVG